MDPITTSLEALMTSLGYGAYIPVLFAVVGLASAIATIYPQTWPGAGVIHSIALMIGKAKPASPASAVPTLTTIQPVPGLETAVVKVADTTSTILKP